MRGLGGEYFPSWNYKEVVTLLVSTIQRVQSRQQLVIGNKMTNTKLQGCRARDSSFMWVRSANFYLYSKYAYLHLKKQVVRSSWNMFGTMGKRKKISQYSKLSVKNHWSILMKEALISLLLHG